ncbi:hypothetical protein CyaNS01_01504 [Cyanobium sp. NS01]|nr:hypothetical protein CyaNS01_01504 [Cyanobium sp. NS01]
MAGQKSARKSPGAEHSGPGDGDPPTITRSGALRDTPMPQHAQPRTS